MPVDELHAEHAEVRWFDRRVEAGGKGESEHPAGVGRIDDAVVPEAGAGVVGVTLALVLGAAVSNLAPGSAPVWTASPR